MSLAGHRLLPVPSCFEQVRIFTKARLPSEAGPVQINYKTSPVTGLPLRIMTIVTTVHASDSNKYLKQQQRLHTRGLPLVFAYSLQMDIFCLHISTSLQTSMTTGTYVYIFGSIVKYPFSSLEGSFFVSKLFFFYHSFLAFKRVQHSRSVPCQYSRVI